MEEIILLSDNLNETEFLRTLALKGKRAFGLRIMDTVSLMNYIMMKKGLFLEGRFISYKEESFLYAGLLGISITEAETLRDSVDHLREASDGFSVLDDDFPLKKEKIMDSYKLYSMYKKREHFYDASDMMDYLLSLDIQLNEIHILKETPLSPKSERLIRKVFRTVKEDSLSSYFDKKSSLRKITKAYGKDMEAASVISLLRTVHLSESTLVLLNPSDFMYVSSYLKRYGIPFTSAIGYPFMNTIPGSLLKHILDVMDNGYTVDSYRALFSCDSFDKEYFLSKFPPTKELNSTRQMGEFIKYLGWLRLSFDEAKKIPALYDENIYKVLLEFEEDLEEGIYHFISKYMKKSENPLDDTALRKIGDVLQMDVIGTEELRMDSLRHLLSSMIESDVAKGDSLHITDLNHSLNTLRENTFIMGLSEEFPGTPVESYLVFDSEYRASGIEYYTSDSVLKRKEILLDTLISYGGNLYLSYSYFDFTELKNVNKTSILYKYPEGMEYSYKDNDLSPSLDVIQSYLKNDALVFKDKEIYHFTYNPKSLLEYRYSPSKIYGFFKKNDKGERDGLFTFILENIFNIHIDDPEDPYKIIAANEKGELIHSLFEGFDKRITSYSELMNKAEKYFNEYMTKRPAIIQDSVLKIKEDIMDGVKGIYDLLDDTAAHVESEKSYPFTFPNGIHITGRFDRLEMNSKGEYILIDFKTGRNVEHKTNDPLSCIQGLIYAYMIENEKNIKISEVRFLYPYKNQISSISYPKYKDTMLRMMDEFKNFILKGEFSCKAMDYPYQDKFDSLISLGKKIKSSEVL